MGGTIGIWNISYFSVSKCKQLLHQLMVRIFESWITLSSIIFQPFRTHILSIDSEHERIFECNDQFETIAKLYFNLWKKIVRLLPHTLFMTAAEIKCCWHCSGMWNCFMKRMLNLWCTYNEMVYIQTKNNIQQYMTMSFIFNDTFFIFF